MEFRNFVFGNRWTPICAYSTISIKKEYNIMFFFLQVSESGNYLAYSYNFGSSLFVVSKTNEITMYTQNRVSVCSNNNNKLLFSYAATTTSKYGKNSEY